MKHASIFRVKEYIMPDPEDGSGTFLENITELLSDYTASHSKREHSLKMTCTCPILNIIMWDNVMSSV
jgi:hypothetical protein